MRRQSTSFEELVLENKKQLLNDPEALAKIDERLDERSSKTTEQDKNYTK
ncbi:FbpB family small basic protein [Halalkalibacter alkalisediminis]|uniref:FbpB family small basic protein n=1 Tax=Halalkalibacter alkalisediminis TaxID=935616 RepID=A0ABV6N9R1_9BACI|nr:FbpB family small basic protein [Halalkalibacter alkalisediminis]